MEDRIYRKVKTECEKEWNNTKDVNKVIDLINFEIDNCCMDYSIALRLIFKLVSLRNRYLYRDVVLI